MSEELAEKKIDTFVNLHNHTHYSLLDGLQKIPGMVDQVVSYGQQAIAITDHGTLSGAIEFYKICKKKGIKPIIGMETYVAPRKYTDKSTKQDGSPYHLTLLARNEQGYKNLMKLSTIACLDGFYYKPRIDRELMAQYSEGLIALSGCIGGEVGTYLLNGNYEAARDAALWHAQTFGTEYYYLEMQPHVDWEPQQKVNAGLKQIAAETGIGLVLTADAHYTAVEDHMPHDILLCVQTGVTLDEPNRMKLDQDLSIHDGDYYRNLLADTPEAIDNTYKIAQMCDLEIELGKIHIPTFDVPENESEKSYLRRLVYRGAAWRYGGTTKEAARDMDEEQLVATLPTHVHERIEYELSVIGKMGYEGYFLIVADLINWSKDNGILCGPGRGSAAGSIIAYVTAITDLDPLKYDLLFERFLNPDRISMPDIDMDFADDRREEVIAYATQKYGQDRVAQIITFGIMAARNAVRDVGRVLGMPYGEVDTIAKLIPAPVQGRHVPLSKSIVDDPDLSKEYENNPRAKKLIDLAMKLEGTIRNAGVHAAGVVISKDPIVEHVPLTRAQKGGVATQYSMGPIEDLGLLKFDFLGLSNLTIIKNTLRIIKRAYGTEIEVSDIPIDDPVTYELLSRGDTTGVFQLESSGMKRYIRELKPNTFEDIVAMVALYRPGPMQWIEDFIARKHNPDLITYEHPKMEDALKNTYGIIVYQEQVMQISKDLCGFTGGQADTLRKAIGKKQIETLAKMKTDFVEGAITSSQADPAFLDRLWKSLEDFAAYCFNKSHAACYALIAVQTAYLKAHYPDAFMAALMTSDKGDLDRIAIEIEECRSMGIEVMSPDVNQSFAEFAVVPNERKIRYALSAIKNVGEGPIRVIEEARKQGGVFASLEDFLKRTASDEINRKALESLIKSGALDSFGERGQLLASLDGIILYVQAIRKNALNGQIDIFGAMGGGQEGGGVFDQIELAQGEPATSRQKLDWEKELLGVYVSGHPLDQYKEIFGTIVPRLSDLTDARDGKEVAVIGLIVAIKKIITKSNDPMLFVTIEDNATQSELLVFPKKLQEDPAFWVEGKTIYVKGKVSQKDGTAKILTDTFEQFTEQVFTKLKSQKGISHQKTGEFLQIGLRAKPKKDVLVRLQRVLQRNPGPVGVVITFPEQEQQVKKIRTSYAVSDNEAFRRDIVLAATDEIDLVYVTLGGIRQDLENVLQ